jgi:hypothetical protein
MPAGALEIEVTESMLVEGGKPAIEALNRLAADGVLIAIDDFGTGYSSFSYLKTMPARVLKLDMSFLVDASADNDAGKIVAAIINMAHALQKEVVAEGIERVDQLKLLKTLGCERGQGYLFGKAVDADQISRTYGKVQEHGAPVVAGAPVEPAVPPTRTPTFSAPTDAVPASPARPLRLPDGSPSTLPMTFLAQIAMVPAVAAAPRPEPAVDPSTVQPVSVDAARGDPLLTDSVLSLFGPIPTNSASPDQEPMPLDATPMDPLLTDSVLAMLDPEPGSLGPVAVEPTPADSAPMDPKADANAPTTEQTVEAPQREAQGQEGDSVRDEKAIIGYN